MTATGLKPPPKFVKDGEEWAWAYVLRKLADHGQVDEHGNPTNYAAANKMFHNVARKYRTREEIPTPVEAAREVMSAEGLTRDELIDMDIGHWIVSRGLLWAANDDRMQRMFIQQAVGPRTTPRDKPDTILEPLCVWRMEIRMSGLENERAIPDSTALWLVRDNPQAIEFVLDAMRDTIRFLEQQKERIEGNHRDYLDGNLKFMTVRSDGRSHQVVQADDFDFGTTLSTMTRHVVEIERAINSQLEAGGNA